MAQWDLEVDGHKFLVRDRPGEPGVYDFDWLSGPAAYGFTSASYDRSGMTAEQMREAINDFLSQVDPETGYIEW